MSAIIHRLEVLEREKPRGKEFSSQKFPFLDTLTEDEKSDCAAYVFCQDGKRPWPSWKERRENEYYEGLIARAMGKPLEEVKAAFRGE